MPSSHSPPASFCAAAAAIRRPNTRTSSGEGKGIHPFTGAKPGACGGCDAGAGRYRIGPAARPRTLTRPQRPVPRPAGTAGPRRHGTWADMLPVFGRWPRGLAWRVALALSVCANRRRPPHPSLVGPRGWAARLASQAGLFLPSLLVSGS